MRCNSVNNIKGGYSDLNRELSVPQTVVLPFELYPPIFLYCYVEVIRTPISKYQKFMTYLLVHNIFKVDPT